MNSICFYSSLLFSRIETWAGLSALNFKSAEQRGKWCVNVNTNTPRALSSTRPRPHTRTQIRLQCLYLYCCSSASSWVIRVWSGGTDRACSWICRTLCSPRLRASLASSARLLMGRRDQVILLIFIYSLKYNSQNSQYWPDMGILPPQCRLHSVELAHFLVGPL